MKRLELVGDKTASFFLLNTNVSFKKRNGIKYGDLKNIHFKTGQKIKVQVIKVVEEGVEDWGCEMNFIRRSRKDE